MDLSKIKEGAILLVMKNKDGTFSPIAITMSQRVIIGDVLSGLSECDGLQVVREIKLEQVKSKKK